MADEFLESEVAFSDHHNPPRAADGDGFFNDYRKVVVVVPQQQQQQQQQQQNSLAVRCGKKSMRSDDKRTVANSAPMNIPERMLRCSDSDEEEGEDDGEGMVPPHVIVGRRIAGKMAFSVCTGNGRTLKGRDLSQVRNSVLRMTGFLEV